MMPAITSTAVREILVAGGHAEWIRGEVTGFHLGEGDTEVLVERLLGPDAGEPYTDDVKTAERIELNRYCDTLREAGYEPDRAWKTHGYRMIVLTKATPRTPTAFRQFPPESGMDDQAAEDNGIIG